MIVRHSEPIWLISSFLILTLRIDESEADRSERLQNWQKFLESGDAAKKEVADKNQQLDVPADETEASETTSTSENPKIESSWAGTLRNNDRTRCEMKNSLVESL